MVEEGQVSHAPEQKPFWKLGNIGRGASGNGNGTQVVEAQDEMRERGWNNTAEPEWRRPMVLESTVRASVKPRRSNSTSSSSSSSSSSSRRFCWRPGQKARAAREAREAQHEVTAGAAAYLAKHGLNASDASAADSFGSEMTRTDGSEGYRADGSRGSQEEEEAYRYGYGRRDGSVTVDLGRGDIAQPAPIIPKPALTPRSPHRPPPSSAAYLAANHAAGIPRSLTPGYSTPGFPAPRSPMPLSATIITPVAPLQIKKASHTRSGKGTNTSQSSISSDGSTGSTGSGNSAASSAATLPAISKYQYAKASVVPPPRLQSAHLRTLPRRPLPAVGPNGADLVQPNGQGPAVDERGADVIAAAPRPLPKPPGRLAFLVKL